MTKKSHHSRLSSRDMQRMQERHGRYAGSNKLHSRFETYLGVQNEGGESDNANGNNFGSSEWLNDIPKNGARQPPGLSGGGKGELYDEEDLKNLFATHLNIMDQLQIDEDDDDDALTDIPPPPSSFSVHDLVMQAITEETPSPSPPSSLTKLLKKSSQIRAIATDVDGTLLPPKTKSPHPRTVTSLRNAILHAADDNDTNRTAVVFVATGKSRKGATDSLGPILGPLLRDIPGVYIQGLYCVDARGRTLFERKLSTDAVTVAANLARRFRLSVAAYDGDDLFTPEVDELTEELHTGYGEPRPRVLPGGASSLEDYGRGFHKLLLMDSDPAALVAVRPLLEEAAGACGACVTQALPTMLEWLPEGCSKAVGVRKVCEALGVDPTTELLALGDAENDAEMLKMACIGVAMGDGTDLAKECADYIMDSGCAEGAAGAAIDLFGFGTESYS
eukprot:CAMPEP_0172512832 /NCGR_PEP_ID=MMETSP1066-20121228/247572_1 /TAXON_ID=671091 /ORGANISM="Coscinodiscus wailesii, Strain CCMP2513" /LENGTH=446 /DNA_ID=CAMNT_0013292809 /DNA_START=172 /DNA_END=1512 /DNA_ORIENTATION=+